MPVGRDGDPGTVFVLLTESSRLMVPADDRLPREDRCSVDLLGGAYGIGILWTIVIGCLVRFSVE